MESLKIGENENMRDDLISRKAVLEILYDISDRNYGSLFGHGINRACDVIEHAETAFYKEKVIEELKANMNSFAGISGQAVTFMFSNGYYNGTKDAIEIVEKGGIE